MSMPSLRVAKNESIGSNNYDRNMLNLKQTLVTVKVFKLYVTFVFIVNIGHFINIFGCNVINKRKDGKLFYNSEIWHIPTLNSQLKVHILICFSNK